MASAIYCWATLIVALVSPLLAVADDQLVESCGIEANRLPPLFMPERYDIALNLSSATDSLAFSGQVSIRAKYTDTLSRTHKVTFKELLKKLCKKVVSCGINNGDFHKRQILLNVGRSLEIDAVQVTRVSAPAEGADAASPEHFFLEVDEICVDRTNQLLAITLAQKLAKDDEIRINLEYHARIGSSAEARGLHQSFNRAAAAAAADAAHADADADADAGDDESERSAFFESAGVNTHFFPADARTTFPCFDQPNMKAVFSLKLIHDANMVAIASTPPIVNKLIKGDETTGLRPLTEVQFADTPRISSYLLAFAVGSYETIACRAKGKTQPMVTAYAPPGRASEAKFTLDTICRAIPLVENYLMRDFPLGALDLVSTRQLPQGVQARENWGLLVFTEDFLLTDADTTPVVREEVAKLATHVLLHTWLGNLVTASWWDDQWIFDGFTLWRSHLLAAELYPELSMSFNYLLRLQIPTLTAQASGAAHPIKTYQDLSATEELELFDTSTYNKAAALFQMTNSMLGQYVMRDSLVKFINDHAYSHANASDLALAFEKMNSGLSQKSYLKTWLDQAGVPLVSVELVGDQIELSQARLLDGPVTWEPKYPASGEAHDAGAGSKSKVHKAELWDIPLDIIFSDGSNVRERVHVSLSEARKRIIGPRWFNRLDKKHWFKLNHQFECFYRVEYSQNVLDRLRAPIESQAMSPQDRLNVIDDMRALYALDKISANDLERVLDWFKNERNGGVLSGLALVLDEMSKRESPAKVEELAHKLFEPFYEKFRFFDLTGEEHGDLKDHADLIGRQDALIQLIKHNHKAAIEEASYVFESSDVHLEPSLRKPVYLAVIKRQSGAQIAELLRRLDQTRSDLERSVLAKFLVQFVSEDDEELRERLMEIA